MTSWLLKSGYAVTAYNGEEKMISVLEKDGDLYDASNGEPLTAKQVADFFLKATTYFHYDKPKPEVKVGENYLLIQRLKVTDKNKPYLDKHLDKLYNAELYDALYLHIQDSKSFK